MRNIIFVLVLGISSQAFSTGVSLGLEEKQGIYFDQMVSKNQKIYLLSFYSPATGPFRQALPRKMFIEAKKELAQFEKLVQKRTPALVAEVCSQRIVFNEGKNNKILCGNFMSSVERKKFSGWFSKMANVAQGRY